MPRRSRLAGALLAVTLLAALAAMAWPGPAWLADRARPFVLGLPFVFAWSIGWLAVTFVALLVYHLASGGGEDR